jgi:hypothetical protein
MKQTPTEEPESPEAMLQHPPAGVPMPPSPAVPAFEKSRQSRVTAVRHLLTDVCCRVYGAAMGSLSAMRSKPWPCCISYMSALRAGDAATSEHKQQDRR